MTKFTFVQVSYATKSGMFKPVPDVIDIDCIESITRGSSENDGRIISSINSQEYLFTPSRPETGTLKDHLVALGASFLTIANQSPIPATQLKWVFIAAFDSENRPVWVNLAKVKGWGGLHLFVGNDIYTLEDDTDLTDILRTTGAGVVIDTLS